MTPARAVRVCGDAAVLAALAFALLLGSSCSKAQKVDTSKAQAVAVGPRGEVEIPFDPEHPLVVDSPEKLFLPGALRQIQEAVARKGYLKQFEEEPLGNRTQRAIAGFQEDNDLAATGFPDGLTIRKLGFTPDEVYRKPPDPVQAAAIREETARKTPRDASTEKKDG